jgi:hypothetical protein
MLQSISDVQAAIRSGRPLLLAGSEAALRQLPRGNWIAGTIPYFMGADGGVCTETHVFVTELPADANGHSIAVYSVDTLPRICEDAPANGFSVLIVPSGSAVHAAYAENAPGYEQMFLRPVIGWVAGVHLSQIGTARATVFDGRSTSPLTDAAVVMHVALPENKLADVSIINVFSAGSGDVIRFDEPGFRATTCRINGVPANLAHYMHEKGIDPRLPLTAEYGASVVNVSVQQVDREGGAVAFYAPVFPGVDYRFAAPVDDYVGAFERAAGHATSAPAFACNCILNYVHANLEGRRTGTITGPMTFGEIAHQLLNQTCVELTIRDIAA